MKCSIFILKYKAAAEISSWRSSLLSVLCHCTHGENLCSPSFWYFMCFSIRIIPKCWNLWCDWCCWPFLPYRNSAQILIKYEHILFAMSLAAINCGDKMCKLGFKVLFVATHLFVAWFWSTTGGWIPCRTWSRCYSSWCSSSCMSLFFMDINCCSDLSAISVQAYLDCSCNFRFSMLFTDSLLPLLVYCLC